MLSIFQNAKDELVEKPISTLGAIAAVAALLINAPEMVVISPPAEAKDTLGYGKQGLVTWMLLYVATCFLFGKFGSLVARRNATSGTLIYPILGIIAVIIGVYLASIYLSSFPLTSSQNSGGTSHNWFGLDLSSVGGLMGLIWTILAIATYWPDKNASKPFSQDDELGVYFVGFVGVMITMVALSALAHSLILGLVPVLTEDPRH